MSGSFEETNEEWLMEECNDRNSNKKSREKKDVSPPKKMKITPEKDVNKKNVIIKMPVKKLDQSKLKVLTVSDLAKRKVVVKSGAFKILPQIETSLKNSSSNPEILTPKNKNIPEKSESINSLTDLDSNEIPEQTLLEGRRNWTIEEMRVLVNLVHENIEKVEKMGLENGSAKHNLCEDAWIEIAKELRKIDCPFSLKNIRQKYSDLKYKANKNFAFLMKSAANSGKSLKDIKLDVFNNDEINEKFTNICRKTKINDILKKPEIDLLSVLESLEQRGNKSKVLPILDEISISSFPETGQNSNARDKFYETLTKYVELQIEEKRWLFEQKKKFIEKNGVRSLQDLQ